MSPKTRTNLAWDCAIIAIAIAMALPPKTCYPNMPKYLSNDYRLVYIQVRTLILKILHKIHTPTKHHKFLQGYSYS